MAAKTMTNKNTTKRGIKVFPKEFLTVTYTKKAKHHKEGDVSEVHPEQAKKLLAKGFIENPEGLDEYLKRTSSDDNESSGKQRKTVKTFGKSSAKVVKSDFRDEEDDDNDAEPQV